MQKKETGWIQENVYVLKGQYRIAKGKASLRAASFAQMVETWHVASIWFEASTYKQINDRQINLY